MDDTERRRLLAEMDDAQKDINYRQQWSTGLHALGRLVRGRIQRCITQLQNGSRDAAEADAMSIVRVGLTLHKLEQSVPKQGGFFFDSSNIIRRYVPAFTALAKFVAGSWMEDEPTVGPLLAATAAHPMFGVWVCRFLSGCGFSFDQLSSLGLFAGM